MERNLNRHITGSEPARRLGGFDWWNVGCDAAARWGDGVNRWITGSVSAARWGDGVNRWITGSISAARRGDGVHRWITGSDAGAWEPGSSLAGLFTSDCLTAERSGRGEEGPLSFFRSAYA